MKDAGESHFTWQMREESEVIEDHRRFAKPLVCALEKRIQPVLTNEVMTVLDMFDASNLVNLNCGTLVNERITFFRPDGEVQDYGVEQCKKLMNVVSKMLHIQASGLNFDSRMARYYMDCLKRAVMEGVWKGLCPEAVDDKEKTIPSE